MSKLTWGTATDWDNAQDQSGVLHEDDVVTLAPSFEMGRVSLSNTIDSGVVESVSFRNTYSNPVVVTYIPTRGGGQSIESRARNVTSTGCEIFNEEPDNEGHATETVCYIVAESGRYSIGGLTFEAGTHKTSTTYAKGDSKNGDLISFTQSFDNTPPVLHDHNTYNNGEFMATNALNVTTNDFELQQMAAETYYSSATERLGWIAFEPGAGDIQGYLYEAGTAHDSDGSGIENDGFGISFQNSYSQTPEIIAKMNSLDGGDGGWARGYGSQWDTNGHRTAAEEDQQGDSERSHTSEQFGWFVLQQDADIGGSGGTLTTAEKSP